MSSPFAAVDWQVASAVVQAGAAVAIAILTVALVGTSRGTLREMRKEREHEHHRRSVRAAQELTRAATELMVAWRSADDDPMADTGGLRTTPPDERPQGAEIKREGAFREWRSAYLTERANILPRALSEDLARFHAAVSTALFDWDAIRLLDDDGNRSRPPRYRPDYRGYRLGWCERRLVASLEAHRRGEDVTQPTLPRDAGALLTLPVGADEDEFAALATD